VPGAQALLPLHGSEIFQSALHCYETVFSMKHRPLMALDTDISMQFWND
jgi:hypothetical protein